MKHFYCDLHVQHLNLHKNWHISFLLVAKSEILYISVIQLLTVVLFVEWTVHIIAYHSLC